MILLIMIVIIGTGLAYEAFTSCMLPTSPWYPYFIDPPYYVYDHYRLNNPNWATPYFVPKWRKRFRTPIRIRNGPKPLNGCAYQKDLE